MPHGQSRLALHCILCPQPPSVMLFYSKRHPFPHGEAQQAKTLARCQRQLRHHRPLLHFTLSLEDGVTSLQSGEEE